MPTAAPKSATAVENLCFNLSSIRKARSLTQAQLGEAAGITRNHYQLLESGRTATGDTANPRLSTLVALADVLDVELTTLLLPPRPTAVWRWFTATSSAVEEASHRIFDDLMTASELHLGNGAAFVGIEDSTLTIVMGIGIKAPDKAIARTIATQLTSAAVEATGLSGRFERRVELDPSLRDLIRTSDA
ncbi:transcriptional regulator with XRE-family HTH domain [Nocardioides sp. BE266]|uniref:helix-turn-helix domain-containing protein n=1 Tax=Nocardioides sp. BE266 TaxID=2817725 RepID=UPI00285F4B47|nr:helix-turn-helix transcriptional regulator [Nocardioides sp. BE266]MDR7252757.1 transcriptional regulator with XRE-family HTH domain [Nocardioides sp. BE266]